MVTREDLESFLIRMDVEGHEVDDGMYVIRSRNGGAVIVAHHSPPLLVLRMKVMDLPAGDGNTELYRTLLVLNATDVVHGAYGIEENELILSDTLELETLDFLEFQASIESMQLAAASHLERIKTLSGAGASAPVEG
jgi:hypothetical protein